MWPRHRLCSAGGRCHGDTWGQPDSAHQCSGKLQSTRLHPVMSLAPPTCNCKPAFYSVYRCRVSVHSQEGSVFQLLSIDPLISLSEPLCRVSPLSVTAANRCPRDAALPAGIPLLRVGPQPRVVLTVMGTKDVLSSLKHRETKAEPAGLSLNQPSMRPRAGPAPTPLALEQALMTSMSVNIKLCRVQLLHSKTL